MELQIEQIQTKGVLYIAVKNTQFDPAFPAKMKQVKGSYFSPEIKAWLMPYTKEAWSRFKSEFEGTPVTKVVNTQSPVVAGAITPSKSSEAGRRTKTPSIAAIPSYFINPESAHTSLETAPALPENPETTDNCVTVRYCAEKPDRVFLYVAAQRKDWKDFVNKTPGKWWHSKEKLWSVPRTKEIFNAFKAFFADKMVIDRETPVVLQKPEAAANVKFEKRYTLACCPKV